MGHLSMVARARRWPVPRLARALDPGRHQAMQLLFVQLTAALRGPAADRHDIAIVTQAEGRLKTDLDGRRLHPQLVERADKLSRRPSLPPQHPKVLDDLGGHLAWVERLMVRPHVATQRSTSPRMMSIVPIRATASATMLPSAITGRLARLMKDGARMRR